MSSGLFRLLLILPLVGAGVVLALTLGDAEPPSEDAREETRVARSVPPQPVPEDAPKLATSGKGKLARGTKRKAPPKPLAPAKLFAAYARAQKLHAENKPDEALALLEPWLKKQAAWFAEPERAAFLRALRTRVVAVERDAIDQNFEDWVDVAGRWGTLREEEGLSTFEARARASAEIAARFPKGRDRDAVMRHVRRFVIGTPARSKSAIKSFRRGSTLNVDALLEGVSRRNGPQDTAEGIVDPETLPIADPDKVEERRLEELDRLRNAGALDLLDTVAASLAWLALYQAPDGHFSDKGAIAVIEARAAASEDEDGEPDTKGLLKNDRFKLANTALATLAFLDFRDQDLRGLFEPTLSRALQWLLKQQREDGGFHNPGRSYYGEAITLMALGQAAAATQAPETKEAVKKGLAWLARHRARDGGFRYQSGSPGDLSVTAWVAQAVETAGWAGVELPDRFQEELARFVRSVRIGPAEFSYMETRRQARRSLAPAGMLAATILFPEDEIREPTRVTWKQALLKHWPRSFRYLYWRYYSVRMIAKLHGGLPKEIAKELLQHARHQQTEGHLAGAFTNASWVRQSGVTGITALTTLMFEHALYVR